LDLKSSDQAARTPLRSTASDGLKIVIVGGFGVGKTTMVRSVSEIRPLSTEETMTRAGVGIDDAGGVHGKTTTTVAFDFGRISLNGMPFIVARNHFGGPMPGLEDLRKALDLSDHVPLIDCDARERESSKAVLIALVNHLYRLSTALEGAH
jgi:signal recognition particle receptor subunit beta